MFFFFSRVHFLQIECVIYMRNFHCVRVNWFVYVASKSPYLFNWVLHGQIFVGYSTLIVQDFNSQQHR